MVLAFPINCRFSSWCPVKSTKTGVVPQKRRSTPKFVRGCPVLVGFKGKQKENQSRVWHIPALTHKSGVEASGQSRSTSRSLGGGVRRCCTKEAQRNTKAWVTSQGIKDIYYVESVYEPKELDRLLQKQPKYHHLFQGFPLLCVWVKLATFA